MVESDTCNGVPLGCDRLSYQGRKSQVRITDDGTSRRLYVSGEHDLHPYGKGRVEIVPASWLYGGHHFRNMSFGHLSICFVQDKAKRSYQEMMKISSLRLYDVKI